MSHICMYATCGGTLAHLRKGWKTILHKLQNFHFSPHLTRTFWRCDIVAVPPLLAVWRTPRSLPFCILKELGGLVTGCQAAASSGPVGRQLSLGSLTLGGDARAGASRELPSWPVPELFITTTGNNSWRVSIWPEASIAVGLVHVHVFQLRVYCCYCLLHLAWTFGRKKVGSERLQGSFKDFAWRWHPGVGRAKTLRHALAHTHPCLSAP